MVVRVVCVLSSRGVESDRIHPHAHRIDPNTPPSANAEKRKTAHGPAARHVAGERRRPLPAPAPGGGGGVAGLLVVVVVEGGKPVRCVCACVGQGGRLETPDTMGVMMKAKRGGRTDYNGDTYMTGFITYPQIQVPCGRLRPVAGGGGPPDGGGPAMALPV